MADRLVAATAAKAERSELADAVLEAVIAASIALILFIPLIGIKTENGQTGLELVYRLDKAFMVAAAVGLIRLFFDLFVWRGIVARQTLKRLFPPERVKRIGLIVMAVFYVLGGIYLIVPDAWDAVTDNASGLFGETGRILSRLTGFIFMATFIILSGMAVMLVLRRLWTSRRSGSGAADLTALPSLAEFREEFAPALLIIALVLPVLVAGPQQRYALDTAIQVLTYIMLGWGLNIVVGLAGLLDLGYVAFYAVGAYSYALISTTFGLSFWVCLPIAGFLAGLWGVILGFPVLRLRGDYLAIVTLAFGEIIRIILINWYSVTHGPDGISRIPKITFFGLSFDRYGDGPKFHDFFGLPYDGIYRIIFLYYMILLLALMVNFVTHRLRRLPVGRAWEALREDEIACRSLGINITTTKLTAFATGAVFAGIGGSFFATRQGFISPESFTFQESALVLAIVVLGGLGSQIGVVIAATVLIGSSEFFRELTEYRMLIFGASMVGIMLWRPRGLVATRVPAVVLKERKAISGNLVREGAG
jgi:branched-chain amino acid transport system permease protein